jgi:hypothetical protein
MLARIIFSTDAKFVGSVVEIKDSKTSAPLPTGETMEITGRMHLGNGVWRFWNSNYILDVEEITNE